MTYSEQLKSPKWQKKRLEILERDKFKCIICGCDDKQLHVHHGAYLSKVKVWEYDNSMLHTLCCDCHSEAEDYIYEMNASIGNMKPVSKNFDILKKIAIYTDLLNDSDISVIEYVLESAFNRDKSNSSKKVDYKTTEFVDSEKIPF
jgi:hypothetical protein